MRSSRFRAPQVKSGRSSGCAPIWNQAIPVVAVTAFAMKGDEERIRESGCEAYLSKPISVPRTPPPWQVKRSGGVSFLAVNVCGSRVADPICCPRPRIKTLPSLVAHASSSSRRGLNDEQRRRAAGRASNPREHELIQAVC
jgi:CheY-like chemotaxis protein